MNGSYTINECASEGNYKATYTHSKEITGQRLRQQPRTIAPSIVKCFGTSCLSKDHQDVESARQLPRPSPNGYYRRVFRYRLPNRHHTF
jgi:hypothetical protein